MDLQKHACNMYVTRLTVGSSPARAQLVDEHPVRGGWFKDQISRLKKGCKNPDD